MLPLNIFGFLVLVSIVTLASSVLEESQQDEDDRTELKHYFPLASNWKKTNFKCPAIYGKYAHESDCSMFYECRYGYPHLMKCKRGKLFDEKKEECKDARRVKCKRDRKKEKDSSSWEDSRSKESSSSSEEVTKEENFRCPYIWGTFPHPVDCSKYFVCIYKVPTVHKCSQKELYDTRSRKCRERRRVNCGDRLDRDQVKTSRSPTTKSHTRPIESTITTPTRPRTTTPTRPRTTTPTRPRTTTPIRTTTTTPIEQTTKTPTRPTTTTPIEPTTTTPVDRTTTETPTTTETHDFGCPFPSGRYADPSNCSLYYECRDAVPTLHQCTESTLYDERKEECRDEVLVRCGERPGGVFDEDSSEENKEKKEEFRCPYTWGLFPHQDDCSKYIICIYNVPTVFNCRKSELFHAKYRRCFPKELVTCDYRVNPDDLIPPSRKTTLLTETTPISTALPTSSLTTIIPTTTTSVPTTTSVLSTTAVPTTTTTVPPTTVPPTTTTVPPTTTVPSTTAVLTTTTIPTTTPTSTTITTPATTTVRTTTVSTTRVTKPNTPPPTDCEEDDLDCIIDDTGDVAGWFDCPERYGHFAHGGSHQLFIHCDNWHPYVKRCADDTAFSPKYLVCMWIDKPGQKSRSE